MQRKAFTLIELLIVVAIIAILAAIAVPNFLEAQTRSKVSRAKADLRSLATGVESYLVDNNRYPASFRVGDVFGAYQLELTLHRITTPIAYMSSVSMLDPFGGNRQGSDVDHIRSIYMYTNYEVIAPGILGDPNDPQTSDWASIVTPALVPGGQAAFSHRAYALTSAGPNRDDDFLYYADYADVTTKLMPDPNGSKINDAYYDPSNGTTSFGDIGRFGGNLRIGEIGSVK